MKNPTFEEVENASLIDWDDLLLEASVPSIELDPTVIIDERAKQSAREVLKEVASIFEK